MRRSLIAGIHIRFERQIIKESIRADNIFIKHITKLNFDDHFKLKPQPHQLQIENLIQGEKKAVPLHKKAGIIYNV